MEAEKPAAYWRILLSVFGIGLFVNCCFLGSGPLAGTEAHRTIVAHQMANGGNWLLPKLYDQVYLAKPPLDYWILAGIEKLTGQANELIWRLPSAIAGSLMAVFLCWTGKRWFGPMGGLAAGVACCGMITLWGQNHTAEIDAMNSLACVVTACLLIDLGFMAERHQAAITLAAGLAFGAAMLLKGPVGLTGIGAALIGPAIFNKTGRALKRPWPWIALAMGSGLFALYAIAAMREFRALGLPLETSGVNEIWINLWNSDRIRYLIPTLFLPVILLVYAMPVSFFFPMAFFRGLWEIGATPDYIWSDRQRSLLRALLGTLAAACAITMLCGFSFPRYSYTWLPLICLVAGAVVEAWHRDIFTRIVTDWLNIALLAAGIGLTVSMGVMAILCVRDHGGHIALSFFLAGSGVFVTLLILRWLLRIDLKRAIVGIVWMILLAGLSFGLTQAADRNRRSAARFADLVRSKVPAGETVTTGHLVLDQPEIFYYSGVKVESYPYSMFIPREFPTSRWLLLDTVEYAAWLQKMPGRLTDVQPMQNEEISAVLAHYQVKNESLSASGQ